MLGRLVRALPQSKLGWVWVMTTILSWIVILGMICWVLAPLMTDSSTLGIHDWDQMESYRYLATKSILRFHQFPFWNPYSCGGHTNWGGFESGTTLVSPWLPFYLTMTLPHAIRAEILGSALLSALGAWLLADRFTRSPALRALVVVAFAVNGRWALQISSGHTWHLGYEWTPWVLYFYDRAVGADPTRARPRRRDVVLAGVCLAMMVYMGGIYPLPHTIVATALYGLFLAARTRSARPIFVGLAAGGLSFAFAAPKLLPILEVLGRYPRLTDSTESIDLTSFFQLLTAHDQDLTSHPANLGGWGWHEFGMYVGWSVVILITLGFLFARGPRESALKWTGIVVLSLGFGAFDDTFAPWTLLHHLPVFKSQHVPSRWLYPGVLLLATVGASFLERGLRRAGALRGWMEVALVVGVAWIARDIGAVARQPISHAFTNHMPTVAETTGPFHTEEHMPAGMGATSDWAPPSLPAEMTNIGTIDCGTFSGLHNYYRDSKGRTVGLGARGQGDPAYRGEVFVPDGVGRATVEKWTPNEMTVRVEGAQAGEHVVLNQNWDPGWTADGAQALNWSDTVANQLHARDSTVVFRYRPRLLWLGILILILTVGGIGWAYRLVRKGNQRPRVMRRLPYHNNAE